MRTLIKYECKRMFTSREMKLSLLVGVGVSVWFLLQYVWKKDVYQAYQFPESLFQKWIGGDSFPVQSFLYYLLLPLIAALPGGAALYEDMENNFIANVCIRCSKGCYLAAKYIAVFLTGGIAFVFPLILNVLIAAAHFPALIPEPISNIGPSGNFMFFELYFSHPWIYLFFFLLLAFLFAGGCASISLLASFYVHNKAGVLLTPFAVYFGVYCINNIAYRMDFSPNYFLIGGVGIENGWILPIYEICFLVVLLLYLWKGWRYE